MQIMEGDLIATIRNNIEWLGHFHTGEFRDDMTESHPGDQWDAVMRAIADAGFRGYVAHEFVPTGDPLVSLRESYRLVRHLGSKRQTACDIRARCWSRPQSFVVNLEVRCQ